MNHVVALSGGKDSTAMALRLAESEPRDYTYVCTPTGNELPEMKAHWDLMEKILGKPLIRVTSQLDLKGQIEFFKALPNNRQRWCTRLIKIVPYQNWIKAMTPATSYVGLRADEDRLGVVYDEQSGITQDYPMKRWGWGIQDVIDYLREKKIVIPKRTDCAWCYDQRIGEWFVLWRDHRDLYNEAIELELKYGHTFRSATRDSWPAGLADLAAKFSAGLTPKGAAQDTMNFDTQEYERCRVCRL
jgi:3'-phosphoadenosine 5'-phosphosulfate sulfotransferase (PAPS reductase)/FAD synthetase